MDRHVGVVGHETEGSRWVVGLGGLSALHGPVVWFADCGIPLFESVSASAVIQCLHLGPHPECLVELDRMAGFSVARFPPWSAIVEDAPLVLCEIVLDEKLALSSKGIPASARLFPVSCVATPSEGHAKVCHIVGGRAPL